MPGKKNTEAPAAKIARNPSDKTARAMYDAVVAHEGTVGGKAARIALYGTKYAALEVGGEGAWEVDHDTAFGGVRAIETLRGGFDEVLVLGGDSREVQLTAGNVAVVEPEIEIAEAAPVAKVDADIAEAFGLAGSPAVEVVAAPALVAEPVLTTLEEVRAAHEAETRGACRASVLRALRVRAGEIALGVPAGGKVAKIVSEPKQNGKWSVWAAEQASKLGEQAEIVIALADIIAAGFGESATKYAACWSPDSSTAGRALAAAGLRGKLTKDGVKITKM